MFAMAGMTQDEFDRTYLNGIGAYERSVAEEEGISL